MPHSKGKRRSANRVVINVGGQRHETFLSTLRTIPDTRLSYLSEHHTSLTKVAEYDSTKSEYFFDRHPGVFAQILNYYRTGRLHCPSDVCGPLFEGELEFWGIDEEQVEMCCWENYKQHRDKQEKLKYFRIPQEEQLEDATLSKNSELFETELEERPSRWARIRPQVWRILDEPYSSSIAKAIAITSFIMFTVFIIKFALSTLPYFQERNSVGFMVLNIIHVITMAWFSMEFVLRAVFSPNKVEFLKRLLTWVDIISLVPMYMLVLYPRFWEEVPYLEMLVMMKVARIFQLFKLSYVIQVLTNTLKASSRELCLLLVIMGFQTVVFSSILYFLERKEKTKDYISVPHSMWWTIITMTTVGYGDVYPRTWFGKVIGSACAICGVLVIALPVSVVATNFSLFYTYAKARLNIPPKKKRVALAHALTAMRIPRCKSDTGELHLTGNPGSLNYPSICSTEGRRGTTTAQPTPMGSEMSLTPTSCQSHYRRFFKDSYHSLQSITSLRPPRITYNAGSRSLSSIPPELSKEQKEQRAREDILFRLDPPSRTSSFVDVSRLKAEEDNKRMRAGQQNEHRGTPCTRSTDDQLQDTALGLTPFLLPARLRMRRGAISMASLSLKSASSNSSYLHWPTSKEGLEDNGPFIILPTNFSLQSLSSIKSGISCSCSSLKSLAKETLHPFKSSNQSCESVITIPVPVLRQPPKTQTTSTSKEPDEAELAQTAATNETNHPPPDLRSTTSVDSVLRQHENSPQATSDMVSEGDMVFLVFPAKVTEDGDQDKETQGKKNASDSVRPDNCAGGGKTTTFQTNEDTEQFEDSNCKSSKLECCDSDDKGSYAAVNDAGVTRNFSSEGTVSYPCTETINMNDSVFLHIPQANSVGESFSCHFQQSSSPKRSRCNATSEHSSCSDLRQYDTEDAVVCNLQFSHSVDNLSSPLQRQGFNSSDSGPETKEKCSLPEPLSNGCLRSCQQSRASCPVLINDIKYDEMSCIENPINCEAHSLQNDVGKSSIHGDARRNLHLSRIPLAVFNRSPGRNGNYEALSKTDHNLCDHYTPHLHADGDKKYEKSHTTSV